MGGTTSLKLLVTISETDAKLRKEFYKTAASQLSLLKSIGISQMEKDLEEKIKFVHRSSTMDELDEEPNLEEANVKEILHDVLTELHSKKTGIEERSS